MKSRAHRYVPSPKSLLSPVTFFILFVKTLLLSYFIMPIDPMLFSGEQPLPGVPFEEAIQRLLLRPVPTLGDGNCQHHTFAFFFPRQKWEIGWEKIDDKPVERGYCPKI